MGLNKVELRIVKITEDLGKGSYVSEDVFSQERIVIILPGKLRMNYFKLPIESVIYAAVGYLDEKNVRGRYIYTWRDPMREDNTKTPLEKQRKELDAKYIELYGTDKFDYIRVYGESKKFKD
ncbi:MAG: hypothetical protein MI974_18765 [Chitinophagales bacterium]|nr:hypothetical protein [Chitinophagales bacterium]